MSPHWEYRQARDARRNCLNLKGVKAIKLEAAPRYQFRFFTFKSMTWRENLAPRLSAFDPKAPGLVR